MISINFLVLGKRWRLKLLKSKKYNKKNGKDSIAITYTTDREIHVSPKGLDQETITHELVHAYMSELCVNSCRWDADDAEEFFCELMAKRGYEVLGLSRLLWTKLRDATINGKINIRKRPA